MSTFVLVHFPTAYSKPVGVWWWNTSLSAPQSYYEPGAENYHDMVVSLLGVGKSEQQWEQNAQKLSDRTPYSDAFQADNISVSPQTYLRALTKAKK